MANGRCSVHGGKSTGPKDSIAYYKNKLLNAEDAAALDIENPMDLTGDIGLVRHLLAKMGDDPLKGYCLDCKRTVIVDVTCPNKEYDNEKRKDDGKRPLAHNVQIKGNDYSDMVKATKLLSDIVKNQKEIQRGKEVTIRIEILNFVVNQVVLAYEQADKIPDPKTRRRVFVEALDRLLVDTSSGEIAERVGGTANRR